MVHPHHTGQDNMKMTKKHKQGIYAAYYLVLMAGGYWMAKNDQIEAVAAKFDMEPWQLEGYYWDVCEAAEIEATKNEES
jgi:hypothetical protein